MADRFSTQLLDPRSSPEWDEFIDRADQGTVFHSTSWLTAWAAEVSILVIRDRDGAIAGGLPLVRRPIGWYLAYRLPPLCPYAGIVLGPPLSAKLVTQHAEQKDKALALLDGIPEAAMVRFPLHHSNRDTQPYQWRNYKVTVSSTYVIDAGAQIHEVRGAIDAKQRNIVRKAEEHGLSVWTTDDIDQFLPLNRMTFERQGLAPRLTDDRYRQLWSRAARAKGTIYLSGKFPNAHAGAVVVHDRRCSYLLMSGGDPATRSLGGGSLILWRAIGDALAQGRSFDFEGSSLPGVEQFYRSWGGAVSCRSSMQNR